MTEEHLGASRIAGPDACRQILLCGEMNPYGTQAQYSLYHEPPRAAGGRLMRILGLQARQHYLPLWRTNLCSGEWDRTAATSRARLLIGIDIPWSIIVMLGVKVATAFENANGSVPGTFGAQMVRVGGAPLTLISLPHPSGRNAGAWSAGSIGTARDVMRMLAPDVPWGES